VSQARRDLLLMAATLLPHTRDPETGRCSVASAVDWARRIEEQVDAVLAAEAASRLAAEPAEAGVPGGAAKAGVAKRGRGRPANEEGLDEMQRARFGRFWAAYGYRRDRGRAAQAWGALAPDAATAERIIAAAAADARGAVDGGAKYASGVGRQYPERWLRGRRWEDDAEAQAAAASSAAGAERRLEAALAAGLKRQVERLEGAGLEVPDALRRDLSLAEARLRGEG
jgi:hypothetical protein